MNHAISRITDENFTEGVVYTCSCAYVRGDDAYVDIFDNIGQLIQVKINNSNFQFLFN